MEKKLQGKILQFKEAVFEEGVELTSAEWGQKLFPDMEMEGKQCRNKVYRLRKRLGHVGYYTTLEKQEGKSSGCIVPLTKSEEVSLDTNERIVEAIQGRFSTLVSFVKEELVIFPHLKPKIESQMGSLVDHLSGFRKLALYEAARQLQSGKS